MAATYSRNAKQILSLAGDEALIAKSSTIAPVHILQGIVRTPESQAVSMIRAIGVDPDTLKVEVLAMGEATASPNAGQDLMSRAESEASSAKSNEVRSEHLLLALTGETIGDVALVLSKYGITNKAVSDAVISARKANRPTSNGTASHAVSSAPAATSTVISRSAAEPVGAYAHARRVGHLLFLAGMGPRKRGSKDIPGVRQDAAGNVISHDIEAQVRSTFENVRMVLEESGSSWANIVDVTVFLTNMKRDFQAFNRLWAEFFPTNPPTRTTVEIGSLPTPIAFEVKVIASIG